MLAVILPFFFTRLLPGVPAKYIAEVPELLILPGICLAGMGIALTTFFLKPFQTETARSTGRQRGRNRERGSRQLASVS